MAAATTLVIALLLNTPLWGFPPLFYVLCAGLALGPQVMGHGAFNYGIRYFSVALIGLMGLIEPVGASLLAYVIFDEVPSAVAMAGMLVVLVAISFVVLYYKRTQPVIPIAD